MHQEDIERFAFLYLCGEHDRKILNNGESMTREDFVRLSYLTYHFGLSAFHMRIWKEYSPRFENELAEQKTDVHQYEIWVKDFCRNAPDGLEEWLEELDFNIGMRT
ncbi:MAG: hypothetical protein ACI4EH_08295 [Oliverpabstia sp.]